MTDLEFFLSEMNKACEAQAALCRQNAQMCAPSEKSAWLEMAGRYEPLSVATAAFGNIRPLDAVATALLAMPMTDWERFTAGAAEYKRQSPEYLVRGKEDEDARGVMLMALKERINSLEYRKAKAA